MASITVNADNNTASVRIGKTEREYPINWVDDLPEFAEPVWAGVLIGKSGSKVWCSQLDIKKSSINSIKPSYTLGAYSGLNSINHSLGWVREIVGFWDEIPENKKSKHGRGNAKLHQKEKNELAELKKERDKLAEQVTFFKEKCERLEEERDGFKKQIERVKKEGYFFEKSHLMARLKDANKENLCLTVSLDEIRKNINLINKHFGFDWDRLDPPIALNQIHMFLIDLTKERDRLASDNEHLAFELARTLAAKNGFNEMDDLFERWNYSWNYKEEDTIALGSFVAGKRTDSIGIKGSPYEIGIVIEANAKASKVYWLIDNLMDCEYDGAIIDFVANDDLAEVVFANQHDPDIILHTLKVGDAHPDYKSMIEFFYSPEGIEKVLNQRGWNQEKIRHLIEAYRKDETDCPEILTEYEVDLMNQHGEDPFGLGWEKQ